MRLWHKDLVTVLPRQQLLSQWRECCAIAKSISEKGTPNHILVNKVMDYPLSHLYTYGILVAGEMSDRGYKVDETKFTRWISGHYQKFIIPNQMFHGWHNERYLIQCYHNLEEKYDCGGVPEDEWRKVVNKVIIYK